MYKAYKFRIYPNAEQQIALAKKLWLHSLVLKLFATNHDRDTNAAINIRNEALRLLSLGTSDTANGGDVNRMGGKLDYLLDVIPVKLEAPTILQAISWGSSH